MLITLMLAVAVVPAGFAASAFVPLPQSQAVTRISTATATLFGMAPAALADEASTELEKLKKSIDVNSEEYQALLSPVIKDTNPVKLSDFLGEAKKKLDQGDVSGALRLLEDTLDESVDRTSNFAESDEPPWLAIGAIFFGAAFLANVILLLYTVFTSILDQNKDRSQDGPTPEQQAEQAALQLRRKLVSRTNDGDVDLSLPPRMSGSTPSVGEPGEEKKETLADTSGKKKRPPVPYIPPNPETEEPEWMRKSA